MDDNSQHTGKKQRHRNQKDRRKAQDKQSETDSPVSAVSNVPDPQPQRPNRRQRGEVVTSVPSNVTTSVASENADTKKEVAEKENITIDFSNLKRETEEIAKLTKKFAKRNISSNWHRYSAPEGPENDQNVEEDGPADFSALIQMPASKGGHLLLKDELEWSSESNEQLGGYFALNLKLLNQSLACIPIYEQLRLPKDMFTEEELKHFDGLASDARKIYNPNKLEDPNELVTKTLTNLIKGEQNSDTKDTHNDFDILKKDVSQGKLTSNDSKPETINNFPKNDTNFLNKHDSSFNIVSENNMESNKQNKIQTNKMESSKQNNDIRDISISLVAAGSEKTPLLNSTEESSRNPAAVEEKVLKTCEQSETNSSKHDSHVESKTREIQLESQVTPENITSSNLQKDIKKSSLNVSETKPSNIQNDLKFDDDDDLDFLLSLKKPVRTEDKKEDPVLHKDSKNKPSKLESGTLQDSSSQQHSELDDWLDSVLQD